MLSQITKQAVVDQQVPQMRSVRQIGSPEKNCVFDPRPPYLGVIIPFSIMYPQDKYQFQVGDIVRRPTGKKLYQITSVDVNQNTHYASARVKAYPDGKNQSYIYLRDLVLADPEEIAPKSTMKTLYKFTHQGNEVFGTHIGTDGSNNYVLEIKGGGGIVVKDPKDIEEVIPWTFAVKINGKETHFMGQPDKVKKGDFLLYNCNGTPVLCTVTGVDTKCKTAREKFKGLKLITEVL